MNVRPALFFLSMAAVSAAWATTPAASAPAASSAVRVAAQPASAASAACPARTARSPFDHRQTSKARHFVMDGDPCADPHSPPGKG